MKIFYVLTLFVLALLSLTNAVPLSPDPDVYCIYCNVDNRRITFRRVPRYRRRYRRRYWG